MDFDSQLIPGVFVKRYKRFFVDIIINNKKITAHCPNTGSMIGLLKEGAKVWLTKTNNKKRKLKYTLQIIENDGNKVGVNTHLTNRIVLEGLKKNLVKDFNADSKIFAEKKFGENTRFDFLIENKKDKSFLEVKNVTLSRKDGLAEFPDAITSRGAKHLKELIRATKNGYKSYLLFLVQREDCKKFAIASDIDNEYSKLLTLAIKNNVKIICYDCKFSSKGIILNNKLKIKA